MLHVLLIISYISHAISLISYIRHTISLTSYIRHTISLISYIRHSISLTPSLAIQWHVLFVLLIAYCHSIGKEKGENHESLIPLGGTAVTAKFRHGSWSQKWIIFRKPCHLGRSAGWCEWGCCLKVHRVLVEAQGINLMNKCGS